MTSNERTPAPNENTRTSAWDSTAKYAHSEISKGNYEKAEKIIKGIPDKHAEKGNLERRLNDKR